MTDKSEKTRASIPVVEERVAVRTRRMPAEGIRARTVVREEEVVVDDPLISETVEVERVPLDRWIEAPIPVRQEGDTMILTVIEEVVVVEKRLRAIEEVRITKRRTERREPQTVTLRREEAIVERLDAAGAQRDPG